jgi:hypothetical protein
MPVRTTRSPSSWAFTVWDRWPGSTSNHRTSASSPSLGITPIRAPWASSHRQGGPPAAAPAASNTIGESKNTTRVAVIAKSCIIVAAGTVIGSDRTSSPAADARWNVTCGGRSW